MKILVTGAAGHLGSTTAKHLLELGYEVRAADVVRVEKRLQQFPLEVADLCDYYSCRQLVTGMDAVIHLGNLPNSSTAAPHVGYSRNVTCNLNMFQAAQEENLRKVLFASSVQVYGAEKSTVTWEVQNPEYLPMDDDSPLRPQNWYALSKEAGEKALEMYSREYGMSAVALRFPMLLHWDIHKHGKAGPNWHKNFWRMLTMKEAARLMEYCLRADLPGYRAYFPVFPGTIQGITPRQFIEQFYPTVPLRKPIDEITSLVDISRITRETGWEPVHADAAIEELAGVRAGAC